MKTLLCIALLATALVGCTTTKLVENPPGSGNFEKVTEVDPQFAAGIEAGKAINEASSPFNPISGAVAIILGATTALAAWQAKRKNDELKKK